MSLKLHKADEEPEEPKKPENNKGPKKPEKPKEDLDIIKVTLPGLRLHETTGAFSTQALVRSTPAGDAVELLLWLPRGGYECAPLNPQGDPNVKT